MFYALYKELLGYSFVGRLTCGVVVHTKIDGVDMFSDRVAETCEACDQGVPAGAPFTFIKTSMANGQ